MDIEISKIPTLLNLFKSFFDPQYHIYFEVKNIYANRGDGLDAKRAGVIEVRITDTIKGGEGKENWSLDYAQVLLTQPKEMDQCVQRWITSFAKVKKVSTLDILGHKNITFPLIN